MKVHLMMNFAPPLRLVIKIMASTKPVFTCSKSIMETLEQCVKSAES